MVILTKCDVTHTCS